MNASTFTLPAADGVALFAYRWAPRAMPKAVVQITHGLAEHAGRYARLAAALNDAGYAVYAHDHRGHGRTARGPEDLGVFAGREGWRRAVDDIHLMHRHIAADHPRLPVVLLGHSLGSFMVQQAISERGADLAGAVLSGSGGRPSALAVIGRLIARLERLRLGPRGRSALIQALSFDAFNKQFAPARTPFDWLSRDPAEVDRYAADPLCGFRASVQLWIDVLDALGDVTSARRQARIPKALPLYIVAGSRDAVSDNAKGLEQLLAAYRAAGLRRVTHRLYPEARHEIFNETNRDEVTRDLVAWLDGTVGDGKAAGGFHDRGA